MLKSDTLTSVTELNELPELDQIHFYRTPNIGLGGFTTRDRKMSMSFSECGEVDLAPLAGTKNLTIYRHAGTRFRNAERLGPGSSATNLAGWSRLWPSASPVLYPGRRPSVRP